MQLRPLRLNYRFNFFVILSVFVLSIAALAMPYSANSGAAASAKRKSNPVNFSRLPLLQSNLAESIETFEADCTTPKSAFNLGETVCAKTDGVDLNYPGGRWVHWLRPDLSIAHGGSGSTLITTNPQTFTFTPDALGAWKVTIAEDGDDSQTPASFTVSQAPESIATYEAACVLAKDNFAVGATVCAKADPNFTGTRFIYWVNSQGEIIQSDSITSTSASATRTMSETGNFWVYLADEEALRSRYAFTVTDAQNPSVDVSVSKNRTPEDIIPGGFITYEINVTNQGPDTAASVELTDPVPANLTYVSSTQDSGPAFTRTAETPTTTWTIASLPPGGSAWFTFVYQVNGGTPVGTEISNSAEVSSTTQETHISDNTATATGTVVSGSPGGDCVLDCPNDIVTTATTQGEGGGANVTFGAPEGFGSCGTITSTPASGSFFPIGETMVVSSSSTGGGSCSFKVTVVDSPAPTISCPSNITVTANEGQGQAFVPDPDGSSSSVGSPTTTGDAPLEVTGSREDGEGLTAAYPLGTTEITWIVTDPAGRQATCSQVITVLPETVLTITCPANVTVASPSGCDPATANPGTPTSNSQTATILGRRSDNLAYSNTPEFNDPYPIGTTTIEWTATDTDTQSASCTQTVTVTGNDTTPPTLNVPPSITTSTSECSVLIDEENFNATAEDDGACGSSVNISRTGIPRVPCPAPGNPNRTCESFVFPTGTTVVTYTATDASGNSTSGIQTVTVNESPNTPPTITAPNDVTVNTGAGATSCGTFVGDATLGTATASDNCPGFVVTRTGVPAGNNFPVGTTTITYRVTDRVGNFTEDTQTVTVIDDTPPVITFNGQTPSMWPPNHSYRTFNVTDFVSGVSDNCGSVSVSNVYITKVTSDEAEESLTLGDGTTFNDMVIAANCKSVQVRAERVNTGNGRVYTIHFKLVDSHGNVTTGTAQVHSPKNQNNGTIDDGPIYTVTSTCP